MQLIHAREGRIVPTTHADAKILEHHCAVPLHDAIARAFGIRISEGWISPLDFVETGRINCSGRYECPSENLPGKGSLGQQAEQDVGALTGQVVPEPAHLPVLQ